MSRFPGKTIDLSGTVFASLFSGEVEYLVVDLPRKLPEKQQMLDALAIDKWVLLTVDDKNAYFARLKEGV